MQNAIERLNSLPAGEAEAELLVCCGSSAWARQVRARRPFADSGQLFAAADEIWLGLKGADWLEAFASHPQIGETKSERQVESASVQQLASRWSAEEQSGTQRNPAEVMTQLAEGNRAYRKRFGYIFIVCASGKSASEILAILEQRLQNDPSAELPIAAEEQRRIMQLRLAKLLTEETRQAQERGEAGREKI